jgi:hypothetical protein
LLDDAAPFDAATTDDNSFHTYIPQNGRADHRLDFGRQLSMSMVRSVHRGQRRLAEAAGLVLRREGARHRRP